MMRTSTYACCSNTDDDLVIDRVADVFVQLQCAGPGGLPLLEEPPWLRGQAHRRREEQARR